MAQPRDVGTDLIQLVAVGDVFLDRADPGGAFAYVKGLLAQADVRFCNLESAITEKGAVVPGRSAYPLRSHPRMIKGILEAGFGVVSVAHNHSLDWGAEALLDTIALLDRVGIARAGGGRDIGEARRPAVVERKGRRLAFLAYASALPSGFEATAGRPGIAPLRAHTYFQPLPARLAEFPGFPPVVYTKADQADLAAMQQDVAAAAEGGVAVFVSVHWGLPFQEQVLDYMVEFAHAAIDAGAAGVIGHHAHVLQAIEAYKGRPIFYGLSNFVFDLDHPAMSMDTVAARCWLGPEGCRRVLLTPLRINGAGQPEPVAGAEAERILSQVERLSQPLRTRFEKHAGEAALVLS